MDVRKTILILGVFALLIGVVIEPAIASEDCNNEDDASTSDEKPEYKGEPTDPEGTDELKYLCSS